MLRVTDRGLFRGICKGPLLLETVRRARGLFLARARRKVALRRAASAPAYDDWHKSHETGSGPWYELVKDSFAASEILEGSDVLEIGCGSGQFAAWMATNGAASVSGEDFSPVAIEQALAAHSEAGLSFRVGDIENIAHLDESFDVVVSCETIEHVPHPAKALAELARVLKPGGTLFLTTPNYLSITGAHRVWREATGRKWDEGGQPIANWTLYPRTARWIRRVGLKMQETSGVGWYLPVPRKSSGYELEIPQPLRRWLKLSAVHMLIQATKAQDCGQQGDGEVMGPTATRRA